MMSPAEHKEMLTRQAYQRLLADPDMPAAAAAMGNEEIRRLVDYCKWLGAADDNAPGFVLGVLLCEAAIRFLDMKNDKGGEA
jgi:hypothetical protein